MGLCGVVFGEWLGCVLGEYFGWVFWVCVLGGCFEFVIGGFGRV